LIAQLVSKIFNLCGHDSPTSQTDGPTEDVRSQDRALHYSASRGKTADVKTRPLTLVRFLDMTSVSRYSSVSGDVTRWRGVTGSRPLVRRFPSTGKSRQCINLRLSFSCTIWTASARNCAV